MLARHFLILCFDLFPDLYSGQLSRFTHKAGARKKMARKTEIRAKSVQRGAPQRLTYCK
jgi:hypothetical protein|tara:strand:+ start:126 stop:302 length:177 start_codon:yes stop_codon:yes gene_type:complete